MAVEGSTGGLRECVGEAEVNVDEVTGGAGAADNDGESRRAAPGWWTSQQTSSRGSWAGWRWWQGRMGDAKARSDAGSKRT
jgi:hypothetical protein